MFFPLYSKTRAERIASNSFWVHELRHVTKHCKHLLGNPNKLVHYCQPEK